MSIIKQSKKSYRFECMINRKRFYTTYKVTDETRRDIKHAFESWKNSCYNGLISNKSYTFSQFAEVFISDYCQDYSPLVIKNYRCNLKNWILPSLGKYKLNEITPMILDGFLNHLKSTNNLANGQAKLSNGSISKIYAITKTIITLAFRKNLIIQNPCSKVKLEFRKDAGAKQIHSWDKESYKKALYLLSANETDYARVCEFAVKTGLRRSEIFGLTWDDINFVNQTISVNKTAQKVNKVMMILPCKTPSSVRTISLSKSIVELLKNYKETHPYNTYIFQNVDYDAVTAWFRKWQRKNNIPRIRFHDLRHTHASLLLAEHIDIKTISSRLGHSNIGITMNTYTHVLEQLDKEAAFAIDNI